MKTLSYYLIYRNAFISDTESDDTESTEENEPPVWIEVYGY